MHRRRAVILLLDMVGYTRIIGRDEEGTIAHQKADRWPER
jgi:class 3 adenylate cyclase